MTELTGFALEELVNVLAEQLDEYRISLQTVKGLQEDTQDWLSDAAAGESRGGFDATPPERWRMEDRLRTLQDLVTKEEEQVARLQKEYDAAWAKLPPDAFGFGNDDDDNE